MRMRRIIALAHQDVRLSRQDPAPFLLATVMPLVLMGFVKPVFDEMSRASDLIGTGAEQAVPGMTIMFGFLLIGALGFNFYREHGWGTFSRLRTSSCSHGELLFGKMIVPSLMSVTNVVLVLGLGAVLFDLPIHGSLAAVFAVTSAFVIFIVAFTLMLVTLSRTIGQLNVLTNMSALILPGLGGALTPAALFPEWVQYVAPISPAYWAMRGFQEAFRAHSGFIGVLFAIAMLALFSVACLAVTAMRFRIDEPRESWG